MISGLFCLFSPEPRSRFQFSLKLSDMSSEAIRRQIGLAGFAEKAATRVEALCSRVASS
jgi:hypothetical protein